MPDWSYRTVLRPLLFRLPTIAARDLGLGVMGTLGRSRAGTALIDFLGHMRAPDGLARSYMGLTFPTIVGLGCGLDPDARAVNALARFGVGFVEIGPVTLGPLEGAGPTERHADRESIEAPDPPDNPGLAALVERLARDPRPGVPLVVRLAVAPGTDPVRAVDECRQMIAALAPHVDAFSLPASRLDDGTEDARRGNFRTLVGVARRSDTPRAVLACVLPDAPPEETDGLASAAFAAGVDGLVVDGGVRPSPGRREMGRPSREPALQTVSRLRTRHPDVVIVASGGVHEPEDALDLLEAGADLVQVDSGLVFSGPGLPKRINDAVLYAADGGGRVEGGTSPTEQSWLWSLLMGAGMLFGSVLALAIAATRVVLPYDEQFAGLTRAQLAAVNERLLPFMAHDRVTLAGTMITIGVLYTGLSLFGIRRGLHWARVAVLASALAGFASFFLFLGFGYFDPFHAFVTALLCQLFLLAVHCRMAPPHGLPAPVLRDDWRWRWSQWGQLGLIAEAVGFVVAGLVISVVGCTQVFVAEDLEFMRTTREALAAAGPTVVPLVAHDRATFGGMLLVSGMTFLMASLGGFRRGARWLWWTILPAGLSGYGAALGVHYVVGYHSPWHLAPAWAGLALFLTAMGLSHPYLCGPVPDAWARRRSRLEGSARREPSRASGHPA